MNKFPIWRHFDLDKLEAKVEVLDEVLNILVDMDDPDEMRAALRGLRRYHVEKASLLRAKYEQAMSNEAPIFADLPKTEVEE